MYTELRTSHPSIPTSSLCGLYTDYTGVDMGQKKLLSQLTHFSEDHGLAAVWLLKYLMTRGCMSDRPKDCNTLRIALMPFARHDLHFLLHNLEVFPDLIGYIILFSQLHRKVSRRHADQMQSLSKSDTINLEKETCFSCVHVKYLFFFILLFFLETHSPIHFPVVRSISGKVLWGHVLRCLFSTFSHPPCCDFLSVFSNGNLV